MSDDIIKKALGMDIIPIEETRPLEGEIVESTTDEVILDFEYVRENLKELISQGQESIAELILIAKQSQHPRAFEVIATLLKATADINSELIGTHKKESDLKGDRKTSHTKGIATHTTQNLFVGSTAELQQFLADMNKASNE